MKDRVSSLIYTSVQDMQSSLSCAETNGELKIEVLREALRVATNMQEITRAKILARYIRKLEVPADPISTASSALTSQPGASR